jgi:hypothetical protein
MGWNGFFVQISMYGFSDHGMREMWMWDGQVRCSMFGSPYQLYVDHALVPKFEMHPFVSCSMLALMASSKPPISSS